jgi:DNA modification methylase
MSGKLFQFEPTVKWHDDPDKKRLVIDYLASATVRPLFVLGDSLQALKEFPSASVDMAMTSPPYWGQREYTAQGIGLEDSFAEYIENLLDVFKELQRVLKPTGSFWLNIGDRYQKKTLLGIPWRVAIAMIDRQKWILRNSVIWNKVKGGMDNTPDKLRNVYEHVFHFTKSSTGYYYDIDAIRKAPHKSKVVNGSVVSATGVSGVRYKRQIELSTSLTDEEKVNAFAVLKQTLDDISHGDLSDFRMIIRGQQRATHSDSSKVSGRAGELDRKGFYILKYHPKGSKPSDVWDIIPEDTQRRAGHYAPYPEDLCKLPIIATCPIKGVVLDPFCGTGTTMYVAHLLNRKSIGIDVSAEYLTEAKQRCKS